MDQWSALGIFMLGAAMGALLSWIAYTARIREFKRLRDSRETYLQSAPEQPEPEEKRKAG